MPGVDITNLEKRVSNLEEFVLFLVLVSGVGVIYLVYDTYQIKR